LFFWDTLVIKFTKPFTNRFNSHMISIYIHTQKNGSLVLLRRVPRHPQQNLKRKRR
jgi:hypothetical protein